MLLRCFLLVVLLDVFLVACTEPQPTKPPPDIPATVEAQVTAKLAAIPTDTPVPTPTPTPVPTPTPLPTETPTPVPTSTPTATPTPTPTPTPTVTPTLTPTPTPTATPTPAPTPTPSVEMIVEETLASVVRIITREQEGTGVIFETSGQTAYIVTAYHLIEGTSEVEAEIGGEHKYRAEVIGYDAYIDLAVLKICCSAFKAASIVDTQDLVKPGAEVMSIGFSLGIYGDASVTRGIVSGLRHDPESNSWLIQTDAPINPGASGGPLLMRNGDVIGINSFYFYASTDGLPTEGLGFAVSGQTMLSNVSRLKSGTRVGFPTPTPYPTATPTATPKPTPTVRWETYINYSYGYQLKYPRGWTIEEFGKESVYFSSPDGYAWVNIYIPEEHIPSASDHLTEWLDWLNEDNPVVLELISKSGDIQLDGGDHGARHVFRYQDSEEYCVTERTENLLVIDGNNYMFNQSSCEHALDRDENYRLVFDEIWDSFDIW